MTVITMKKISLAIVGLGASLLTAGYLLGQAPAAPAAKPQKLVRVSSLKTVEANREFQANVQVLQAQRQAAVEFTAALEKETNAARKKDLKTQLDALLVKLNDNNDKMRKAYGFSLDRNYTLVIETAHVYMFVTDEEAAKIAAAESGKK